jgi:hypothetical protein
MRDSGGIHYHGRDRTGSTLGASEDVHEYTYRKEVEDTSNASLM